MLGVKLLLIPKELLSLELYHFSLLGKFELDAVAAIVVLPSQGILLLPLQSIHLSLQLLEISNHLLEMSSILVVFPLHRGPLLRLKLLVDGPEEGRVG